MGANYGLLGAPIGGGGHTQSPPHGDRGRWGWGGRQDPWVGGHGTEMERGIPLWPHGVLIQPPVLLQSPNPNTAPQNANAAPPDPNVTPPRLHPTPPAAGSSAVPGLISLFFRRGDLGLINPNPAWGGGVGGGGSTDAALIHPGLPSPQRGTPKISLLGSPWAGCTLRYPIPVMSPKRG